MYILRARNVHEALPKGLAHIAAVGVPMPSRGGDVLVAPLPVITEYINPLERVIFWPERDANPFFHFFEGLWMLAGRNDLAFVKQFVGRMASFSDDGVTLAGAYGYRWRQHFHFDQLERVVKLIKAQPFTRRAVIAMWDPPKDLQEDESATKDACCNTQVMLRVDYGRRDEANQLHMTVINRSNDIIWGLYGANAVHMSMLQEYLAAKTGLAVGGMMTWSNNFHAYKAVYETTHIGALRGWEQSPYTTGEVAPYPMVANPDTWDRDLALFLEDPNAYGYDNPWFAQVVKPLWWAHVAVKRKSWINALEVLEQCRATDWRKAVTEWVQRRKAKA